jgi:NADPH:quinone reductase-like Zn-dependent oxidoreductase
MNASALRSPAADSPSRVIRGYAIQRGEGIDGLVLRDIAAPALGALEVRVRMKAVALNQRDLMIAKGLSGVPGRTIVPASDGAGEVVEVGADVTTMRVGDRVVTTFFPDWIAGAPSEATVARALGGSMEGVLAEEVVLPERAWVPMPAHLSYFEAATLTCAGVTAWHALFGLDPLRPGASVALLGTGGVSIWALQLAKAAGLRVIITSSDEGKLERARQLGADATINYRTTPQWGVALRELTAGIGVDRVLDIGGPDTVGQSIDALRMGGTVAIIGRLTGSEPARFDPVALYGGGKKLVGLMVGSRTMTAELARFVEDRQLRPVIDRVFRFEQASAAYAYLGAAGHLGKVVVAID